MKQFKFEITLTEDDLDGDEYWENALEVDGTGIKTLTETLEQINTKYLINHDNR